MTVALPRMSGYTPKCKSYRAESIFEIYIYVYIAVIHQSRIDVIHKLGAENHFLPQMSGYSLKYKSYKVGYYFYV